MNTMNTSVIFPSYTVGIDAYDEIKNICSKYGKKIIVIGGKRALKKAKNTIQEGVKDSELEILDFIWYGGEASIENIEALEKNPKVQAADMIFAVGGGKAIDTGKVLAHRMEKPFFTFPTIASTCASCTSLGILYYPNGELREYSYSDIPPVHIFINTKIIAEAPTKYLWAGIGDTLAKYYECTVSARGDELSYSDALGKSISVMSAEPLIKYGTKALQDCENNQASYEVEQIALGIIISTGFVSNLVVIDYNTGLAHAVYNGLTVLEQTEHHLHGEIVAYGVLVLLTCDKQYEELERVFAFNQKMGLPTKLSDIGVSIDEIEPVIEKASQCMDIKHWPYEVTYNMIFNAIKELEEYNNR